MHDPKLERIRTGFSREIYDLGEVKDLHRNDKQGLIVRQILRRAAVLDDTTRLKKQYLRKFDMIQKL